MRGYRLLRLSLDWLRAGVKLERIEPGKPQQNGRHERMHRTLKAETSKPPAGRQADMDLGCIDKKTNKFRRFGAPRSGRAEAKHKQNTVTHVSGQ